MCVVEEIAATIDASGMTIKEVAKRAFLDDRTIYKIKAREQQPKSYHVYAISRATNEPTPMRSMCYEACIIGQRFGFRPLNNVNKALIAALSKSKEELEEFATVLQNHEYFRGFQEMLDILHCGQEIVDASIREWGFDRIANEFQKHHDKCIKEGYIKEKDAIVGAI